MCSCAKTRTRKCCQNAAPRDLLGNYTSHVGLDCVPFYCAASSSPSTTVLLAPRGRTHEFGIDEETKEPNRPEQSRKENEKRRKKKKEDERRRKEPKKTRFRSTRLLHTLNTNPSADEWL